MSTNTAIQIKKSGYTGNTPIDLTHGELALNYADGKLFYKDWLDNIEYITNQQTFSTVNANSSLLIATSPTDVLSLAGNSGITITGNGTNKTITIGLDQSIFSSGVYANAAFIQANAAYTLANTIAAGSTDVYARSKANGAFDKANSAYTRAYDSVLKTGDTMTGDLHINTANIEVGQLLVETKLYSGLASRSSTPLPNLIAQFTGNTDSYVQVNAQNIDQHGSADYVITGDVGTDTSFYADFGLNGSQQTTGSIKPLDGYLYIQGSEIGQLGGNLIIGTTSTTPGIETRIVVGGYDDANVVMTFSKGTSTSNNNLAVNGHLSVNTSLITSTTYTTSNTNQVVIDVFDSAYYRSAKYDVQMTSGSDYHVLELRALHDGSNPYMTQYGELFTSTRLGSFDADLGGGKFSLKLTPSNSSTTIKLLRTVIAT
jgi:hypothetical protein